MAKVRVHELAKKYDVTSKEVLGMLSELGEFVKAASSTVEPPVVKRFQDKYGSELTAKAEAKAAKKPLSVGLIGIAATLPLMDRPVINLIRVVSELFVGG